MKESYGHGRTHSTVPLLPYADSTPPSTPFASSFRTKNPSYSLVPPRRKSTFILCAFASVVSLGVLASWAVSGSSASTAYVAPQPAKPPVEDVLDVPFNNVSLPEVHEDDELPIPEELPTPEFSPYVLGPPTQSFRDNLRNDTKYITSWLSAGWSASTVFHLCLLC